MGLYKNSCQNHFLVTSPRFVIWQDFLSFLLIIPARDSIRYQRQEPNTKLRSEEGTGSTPHLSPIPSAICKGPLSRTNGKSIIQIPNPLHLPPLWPQRPRPNRRTSKIHPSNLHQHRHIKVTAIHPRLPRHQPQRQRPLPRGGERISTPLHHHPIPRHSRLSRISLPYSPITTPSREISG